MNGADDTNRTGNQEPNEPQLPAPIPSQNETILPHSEGNPSDDRIQLTVNAPTGTRVVEWFQIGINAALAINGVKTAQDGLAQARDSFRQDQRPYVSFAPANALGPPEHVSSGIHAGQLAVVFNFTNYGKSPAIEVRQDSHIVIGKYAWKKVKLYAIPSKHGSIVPTGDQIRNAAYSDETIDETLFKEILSGDVPFIVFGHFEYTDMYAGTPALTYSTEFCQISVGSSITNGTVRIGRLENGICAEHTHIK